MRNAIKLPFVALMSLLVLAGCETNDESEEFRIAELKPIATELEVEQVWTQSIGGGVSGFFSNLKPAATADKVFVANRAGEVKAIDLESGDTLWSSDIRLSPPTWWTTLIMEPVKPAKLSGGVTAAYNNIYVGTEDGEVVALSQETGEVLWRTEVKGEVVAPPAAGDGWIAVTTTSGYVATMHPDTGELRWEIETDVPALTLRGTSSPTISNGGVMVGTATGKLMVMILDAGIPAWDASIGQPSGSTELEQLVDSDTQPLIIGSSIYTIGYNGNLASVNMSSGQINWKREYSSYRNLAVDFDSLYLTDAKGNVTAVGATNGVEKWTSSELYNRRLTTPVVYQNKVVVGDFEGYVHFLDKQTGEIVARYNTSSFVKSVTFSEDGAYSTPVVAGDKVIIQTRDGEITALRLP